ncbi:MAG: metal-dependent transcriptional regulator [Clostridia bacterium]
MEIHESAEDYLEMILMLRERKGYARAIDIAMGLGVSKPSVSYAIKQLRENGYLWVDKENLINLSDTGEAIAERVYHRHRVLTDCFVALGVNAVTAHTDACKVEHDLSEETFQAIAAHARECGSKKSK